MRVPPLHRPAILCALLVGLALFSARATAGEGTTFRTPASWSEVTQAAAAEQKYLFLDAYTDWCGWCKVMDRKTFADSTVAQFMNQQFVNAKVEMERGFGIDLAMKYRVSGFPQFLIFAPDGRLVYRMFGYRPPAEFMAELRKALDPATQQSFPGISTRMDLPYPSFLRDAFKPYKDRTMPSADVVATWLDQQSDPTNEVVWTVLNRCAVDDQWESWILANYDRLATLYGDEAAQRVYRTLYSRANDAIKQGNDAELSAILAKAPSQLPNQASVSAALWLQMHSTQQRWPQLIDRLATEFGAGTIDISVVNEHCWTVYEKCSDTSAVRAAVAVMAPAMKTESTDVAWSVWDTYAALQFKAGDLQGAETSARVAIDRGITAGEDTTATRELLAKIQATMQPSIKGGRR